MAFGQLAPLEFGTLLLQPTAGGLTSGPWILKVRMIECIHVEPLNIISFFLVNMWYVCVFIVHVFSLKSDIYDSIHSFMKPHQKCHVGHFEFKYHFQWRFLRDRCWGKQGKRWKNIKFSWNFPLPTKGISPVPTPQRQHPSLESRRLEAVDSSC